MISLDLSKNGKDPRNAKNLDSCFHGRGRLLPLQQRVKLFLTLGGAFLAGRSHAVRSVKLKKTAEAENEAWLQRYDYRDKIKKMSNEDEIAALTKTQGCVVQLWFS